MGEAPELHQSDTEAYSSSKINLDCKNQVHLRICKRTWQLKENEQCGSQTFFLQTPSIPVLKGKLMIWWFTHKINFLHMPNDDMEGSSSRIAFFPCEIWKEKMVQNLCSCKLQFVLKNFLKKNHIWSTTPQICFLPMPKEMADMEAAPEIASEEEEYTEELWVVASTKILISSFQQGDHVLN
jgi:hypothetical protein